MTHVLCEFALVLVASSRQGLVSNVLRFEGKMVSEDPIDRERLFIISFYLSDDTISVFEPPQRNSGVKFALTCVTSGPQWRCDRFWQHDGFCCYFKF